MARVEFSAIISTITGKLSGSVFQLSYGGFQLRSRVVPRNPQVARQQAARMSLAFISATWRDLTQTERDSWINNAPSDVSGFNFYTQSNCNLALIGLPMVNSYTSVSTPGVFGLVITGVSHVTFNVAASGPTFVVPSSTVLLVTTSRPLSPALSFLPRSWLVHNSIFAAGVDLTVPTSILSDYFNAHGSIIANKKIYLSACLIDSISGQRGASTTVHAIST